MRYPLNSCVAYTLIVCALGLAAAPNEAAAQVASAATPAPAPKAVSPAPQAAAPAAPSKCTRLPLSDIKLGREETIASARLRLDEYAASVAKKRGWKGTKKSDETVTCADYLYLPLLGQEYKCLVTATFCPR